MSTLASTLLDFILDLFRDPQKAAAYEADPQGALDAAGLSDSTPADVADLAPMVSDFATVGGWSGGSHGGGSHGGGRDDHHHGGGGPGGSCDADEDRGGHHHPRVVDHHEDEHEREEEGERQPQRTDERRQQRVEHGDHRSQNGQREEALVQKHPHPHTLSTIRRPNSPWGAANRTTRMTRNAKASL